MADDKGKGGKVIAPGRPKEELVPDPKGRPPPGSKPTPVPDPPKEKPK